MKFHEEILKSDITLEDMYTLLELEKEGLRRKIIIEALAQRIANHEKRILYRNLVKSNY
jgi:hypothetical protein